MTTPVDPQLAVAKLDELRTLFRDVIEAYESIAKTMGPVTYGISGYTVEAGCSQMLHPVWVGMRPMNEPLREVGHVVEVRGQLWEIRKVYTFVAHHCRHVEYEVVCVTGTHGITATEWPAPVLAHAIMTPAERLLEVINTIATSPAVTDTIWMPYGINLTACEELSMIAGDFGATDEQCEAACRGDLHDGKEAE